MDVRKWKKFQPLKKKSGFAFLVLRFANIRSEGFARGGRPDQTEVRQPFDHMCDTDRKHSVREELLAGVHCEMSAEEGPGGT